LDLYGAFFTSPSFVCASQASQFSTLPDGSITCSQEKSPTPCPHLAARPRPPSPCLPFGRQPLVLDRPRGSSRRRHRSSRGRPTEEQTQSPMGWSHCRTCVGSGTRVDKLPAASNRTYLDAQGRSAAGARRGKADCPGSVQPAGRRAKPAGAGPDGRWRHGSGASPRVTTVAQAHLRVAAGVKHQRAARRGDRWPRAAARVSSCRGQPCCAWDLWRTGSRWSESRSQPGLLTARREPAAATLPGQAATEQDGQRGGLCLSALLQRVELAEEMLLQSGRRASNNGVRRVEQRRRAVLWAVREDSTLGFVVSIHLRACLAPLENLSYRCCRCPSGLDLG
jgi:hypothetical protein